MRVWRSPSGDGTTELCLLFILWCIGSYLVLIDDDYDLQSKFQNMDYRPRDKAEDETCFELWWMDQTFIRPSGDQYLSASTFRSKKSSWRSIRTKNKIKNMKMKKEQYINRK